MGILDTLTARIGREVSTVRYGDDAAAFQAALTAGAGGVVTVPAGAFTVAGSGAVLLTIPAGTTLRGAGIDRTTITLDGSASFWAGIVPGAGVVIEDMTIVLSTEAAAESIAARFAADGLTLRRVKFVGDAAAAAGTFSKTAHGVQVGEAASADDLTIEDCEFTGLAFPILRANNITTFCDGINITNSRFHGNFREDISLNAPSGTMKNVVVSGNRLWNNLGAAAGLDSLGIALANVQNFSVTANVVSGPYRVGIYFEELSGDGAVVGNAVSIAMQENGAGIACLDNNKGGSVDRLPVRRLTITGNSLTHTGTAKATATHGVWLVNNAITGFPAEHIQITGNIASNVQYGYSMELASPDVVRLAENMAVNCAAAGRVLGSRVSLGHLTAVDCDAFIATSSGGSFLLPEYADDAAAATGGVPVGGRYRTGSTIKVRVA